MEATDATAKELRAGIITPPGEGGIGIVAVEGEDAPELVDRFFEGTGRSAADLEPGRLAHGKIREDGQVLDEVIVAQLDPEMSPSGARRCEVNCHGGAAAVQAVLDCFRSAGAQPMDGAGTGAGPAAMPDVQSGPRSEAADGPPGGRRAYDVLSRGNIRRLAIELLPRAETRLGARTLLHQWNGALADELKALGEADDSRREGLNGLLRTAPAARALTEPPSVAIVGPPNAGKSTLLNALLQRERVLVHDRPGTTRDVVRETVSVRGMPFELMDSAGVRNPAGEIEAEAVQRARELAEQSDICLLVYDLREGPDAALDEFPRIGEQHRVIAVGNKLDAADGEAGLPALPGRLDPLDHVAISAREGRHIERLEDALLDPYEVGLHACREGRGVLFAAELEEAVREMLPG